MLKELFIENLAVIEKASIPFTEGLNVFTGETGAGKSVLVGGLAAVLGFRSSSSLVRTGSKSAKITAVFSDIDAPTLSLLREFLPDDDFSDELILSREITSEGKSSARINGKPAAVSQLREIGDRLVNIHGQHETSALFNPQKHLELIDSYAALDNNLNEYRAVFKELQNISKQLKNTVADEKERQAALLAAHTAVDEISKHNIKPGEDVVIEHELDMALNAEVYKSALEASKTLLTGGDDCRGIKAELSEIKQMLGEFKDSKILEITKRIESLLIEAEDIAPELTAISNGINLSAEHLKKLEDRKRLLDSLKRKYGGDLDSVLQTLNEAKRLIDEDSENTENIHILSERKKQLLIKVTETAETISKKRRAAAQTLTSAIASELSFLDMPKVRIEFKFESGKLTANGFDSCEMLISVNPGEALKPLAKVASGGELSRIMLAIKCITAQNEGIATMVFDEIDSGVSGRAAGKIGSKLRELGNTRQVIVVTHLAQIAVLAENHLLIEKRSTESETYTEISRPDREGRIREIARIQVGENITETALRNAEEQLFH